MPSSPTLSSLRPAQYAVLALLERGATHGYELQRAFADDGDLGAVVRLEQANLYATLKTLDQRGLITGREERDGARPPRTVYALTPDGRQALAAWRDAPVRRMREVRLDFLLKIYFARDRGADAVQRLIDRQIAACRDYLADLDRDAAALPPDAFGAVVVASKRTAAEATLAWLQEYRDHA